jgi:hypothetical protein
MTNLVISNVVIKQDENLRYRLNDLHKASGLSKSKSPSEWLRLQNSQELVELLRTGIHVLEQNQVVTEPLVTINGGNKQGVYGLKELVYAYAMWLSPEFHLHVIRAYDALVQAERKELEWLIARGGTKQEYKNMTLALKNYYLDKGEVAPFYAYTNDADMLNLIVIGMKSKAFKQMLSLDDNTKIRDYLNQEQLKAYEYLENRNAGYLDDGLDYTERAIKLKGLFDKKFKNKILESLDTVSIEAV